MHQYNTLLTLLQSYQHDEAILELTTQLNQPIETTSLIKLYHQAIPLIEEHIWKNTITDSVIENYQLLFHELENIITDTNKPDNRNNFIIAIPVADRPQHLFSCLNSILTLCKNFQYGGSISGTFNKIQVVVSDDSKETENIEKNRNMCKALNKQGLQVIYFGQDQQKAMINSLDKKQIINIIGDIDEENFSHKGASITRNITYLKLKELQNNDDHCLFYFIDSDQEFQITSQSSNYYAINYFYYLDRIFTTTETSILTGKVVGDPPVSPAVMAGTFLDDLILFIRELANLPPYSSCEFHQSISNINNDAAYHDMAELFGFKGNKTAHDYHCTLTTKHSHTDCFTDFSNKLDHFFDGEHPTRKTYFKYENILKNIKPARTIYTGNYIFKPENLKYFIPFANLKLRMAGPVLGRIIKSDLKEKFVSANLPMLHKRTIDTLGQSEFRPGVNHKDNIIDLSGEFTRQFFGDVMLFSMIELTDKGYPNKNFTIATIKEIIHNKIITMQEKYNSKQNEIISKSNTLKSLISDKDTWWNLKKIMPPVQNFEAFIKNIEFNFGSDASIYKIIHSQNIVDEYHADIFTAIMTYKNDISAWKNILSTRDS